MTDNFIKKTNISAALSLAFLETIKSPEMSRSAWFNYKNLKKTSLNQRELEAIWQKIETKNDNSYCESIEKFKDLILKFTDLVFAADAIGKQAELVYLIENFEKVINVADAKKNPFQRKQIQIGL